MKLLRLISIPMKRVFMKNDHLREALQYMGLGGSPDLTPRNLVLYAVDEYFLGAPGQFPGGKKIPAAFALAMLES